MISTECVNGLVQAPQNAHLIDDFLCGLTRKFKNPEYRTSMQLRDVKF